MIIKEMTYVDYNGNNRTEEFCFNLTKAELMEMQLSTTGGMENMLKQIVATQDTPKLIEIFKKIILSSYGVKSPDGKRFIKNQELTEEFEQTEAYSDLFMLLVTDADEAAKFINGVIPQDLKSEVDKQIAAGQLNDRLPQGYESAYRSSSHGMA